MKIVIIDFNEKIGSNNNYLTIMSPHEFRDVCNNNGEYFCMAVVFAWLINFSLMIRYPIFKDIYKYSSHWSKSQNQIDVLISKSFLSSLTDVQIVRSANMYTATTNS